MGLGVRPGRPAPRRRCAPRLVSRPCLTTPRPHLLGFVICSLATPRHLLHLEEVGGMPHHLRRPTTPVRLRPQGNDRKRRFFTPAEHAKFLFNEEGREAVKRQRAQRAAEAAVKRKEGMKARTIVCPYCQTQCGISLPQEMFVRRRCVHARRRSLSPHAHTHTHGRRFSRAAGRCAGWSSFRCFDALDPPVLSPESMMRAVHMHRRVPSVCVVVYFCRSCSVAVPVRACQVCCYVCAPAVTSLAKSIFGRPSYDRRWSRQSDRRRQSYRAGVVCRNQGRRHRVHALSGRQAWRGCRNATPPPPLATALTHGLPLHLPPAE